ncbi:MAG: alpha/beta hydrolase [Solirubrobacteraceae bacterium]
MRPSRRRGLARRRAGRIPRRLRRHRRGRRPADPRLLGYAAAALLLAAAVGVVLVFTAFRKPQTEGARVLHFTVDSGAVHAKLRETVVVPPGSSGAGRPLLVFLHGSGVEEQPLSESLFDALSKLGSRAPDIVFPAGGAESYWHDRASGGWGSYVYEEVLPQAIARLHADGRRVAIGGVSMGGFGAYDIALLHPHRFCAVAGNSPALWLEAGEAPAGAFEGARDFERNNVIGAAVGSADPYPGAKLWLDVGSADPLRAAVTTLAEVLRAKGRSVAFHVWPGGHEASYWQRHWGGYLDFYASALAGCATGAQPQRSHRRG